MTDSPSAAGAGGLGRRIGQGIAPVVIYLASFAALGLSFSLIGPALSRLQAQTGTSLGAIGVLFTAQSFGYLVGSLLGGNLYDRGLGHRVLGTALLVLAAALLAVPHITSLVLLAAMFGVIGAGAGAVDVGGNTLLIWRRGGSDGASLNALHLCFGIGALASPIIVAWSLSSHGDLVAASMLMAVPTAAIGVWALLRPSPDRLADADHASGAAAPARALALVAVFFFLYVGVEIGFAGWIYTYAQAVHLGGEQAAAAVTATFWGAFLLGRLLAVGVATRAGASAMLVGAGAAAVVGAMILAVGDGRPALVWTGTIVFGSAIAPLYPTMLAFVGDHLPLSGTATSWFVAASAVGGLTLPWMIGVLFDHLGPGAMPVTVLLSTVACVGWVLVIRAALASTVLRTDPADPIDPVAAARLQQQPW